MAGKKNRKHGRNKRAPAFNRYVAGNVLARNKARKIAKHLREVARKAGNQ
jgi:hypothetical protein